MGFTTPRTLICCALLATYQLSTASALQNDKKIRVPQPYLKGFQNPTVALSQGGSAICITGILPVTASAQNMHIPFPPPQNQSDLTDFLLRVFSTPYTFPFSDISGPVTVNLTAGISASLCYPASGTINASTVQILTHGFSYDKSHWDFQPGYSYVDIAAQAGFATLSYDRLGVGGSLKPDGINIVQAPLEVAIAAELVSQLRAGAIASTAFENVVGVGNSFGCAITQALTNVPKPGRIDSAVLTGFGTQTINNYWFLVGLGSLLGAAVAEPGRFRGRDYAYMIASGVNAAQIAFFRQPFFDHEILVQLSATRETYTLGELFTASLIVKPALHFAGPAAVMNPQYDWPFCLGNCTYPTDIAAQTLSELFPAASSGSESYIIPDMAHAVFLHYESNAVSQRIQSFFERNEF